MPARTPQMHLRRGFSLIEIMVAVGIIVLLVAIAFPVFELARTTAVRGQATSMLNALETVEVEYEAATQRRIWHLDDSASDYQQTHPGSSVSKFYASVSWGTANQPYTVQGANVSGTGDPSDGNNPEFPEVFIERFIALVDQVPTAKTALYASAAGDTLVDTDGDNFAEVVDPWGTPIVYASFVSHSDGGRYDDDDFLPQRGDLTQVGIATYVPVSPAPFFVSAGPDGDFGDVQGTDTEKEAAEDNLLSFDGSAGGG